MAKKKQDEKKPELEKKATKKSQKVEKKAPKKEPEPQAEPQPLPFPDLAALELKRANPYLLEYNGKIIDEATSYYLRFHLRKFFRNKYSQDRMEMSFTQDDLNKALADGFKV